MTHNNRLVTGGLMICVAMIAGSTYFLAVPKGTSSTSGTFLPAGNTPAPPVSYQYNTLGQVEKILYSNGSTYAYRYDTHGDKISETDPSGKTWVYTYDQHQQIVTMIAPTGQVTHGDTPRHQ